MPHPLSPGGSWRAQLFVGGSDCIPLEAGLNVVFSVLVRIGGIVVER